MRDAFLLDAARTPRGRATSPTSKRPGALAGTPPVALLRTVLAALAARADLSAHVTDVVMGCSTQTGEQGANIAKIAALVAGLPAEVSGVTLNRFCASGIDALAYAALKVAGGADDLVIAGGVESMSRVPMMSDRGPWFADPEIAAKTGFVHMGVAADLLASIRGYAREDLDAVAAESHARAVAARAKGPPRSVVPVISESGEVLLGADEGPREGSTADALARLEPAFAALAEGAPVGRLLGDAPMRHLHTVATSPLPSDGASALLVGTREIGSALGLRPRARVLASATASVDPTLMLTGNVPAVERALARAGVDKSAVDHWECNESFAATVLDFVERLGLDAARVNTRGGAIALGHPLGATGGVLVATLLERLEEDGGEIGVVTTCAGAGLAQAVVVARV